MRCMLAACAFALVPGVATASLADDGWSYAGLEDDLHLTELLRNGVQSNDDREIGSIRDVMIGEDGTFEAVVVSFDPDDADATALMLMEWSDTALSPGDDALAVSIGTAGDSAPAESASRATTTGVQARKLFGTPVHLNDARDFGEVSDILVDPGTRQPSAVLVSAGGDSYALPLRPGTLRAGQRSVTFDYSRADVQALGTFDPAATGQR